MNLCSQMWKNTYRNTLIKTGRVTRRFLKWCVQGQMLVYSRTQSARNNKSSWNKKLLVEEERVRTAQKMGEDVYGGPFSFWELRCLYYIPSVSCYSSLPASPGRGLTRKKSGDREAQEGIPGHKRFTSPRPQPVFQPRTIHEEEEKIWSKIGSARWGRRGEKGWAWMTYEREIYTLRNKAVEFSHSRINYSWEEFLIPSVMIW